MKGKKKLTTDTVLCEVGLLMGNSAMSSATAPLWPVTFPGVSQIVVSHRTNYTSMETSQFGIVKMHRCDKNALSLLTRTAAKVGERPFSYVLCERR